jgi:putative YphP/YqiW family bacilliredoxin
MQDLLIRQMINEVTRHGVQEMKTPEEVDATLQKAKGTTLVFVNSVCGCAGGIARPALGMALQHHTRPDHVTTVFASTDREAAARAREYFTGMPPSSPSFALLRDGKLVHMIHRSDIEMRHPQEVSTMLTAAFEKYCAEVPQEA